MGMSLSLGLGLNSANIGGGGVTPITILDSSLFAWWSTYRADLITLSGSQVTSWRDVVGGYDAVQAVSASRPIYSATSFNGAPGITADAVDDELTLAPLPAAFPIGGAGSEMWSILSQDVAAATVGVKFIASYGGSGNFRRTMDRTAPVGANRASNRGGTGAAETTNQEPTADFSSRHVLRARFGGASNTLGITLDNGAETTTALALAGTTADRLRLFASSSIAAANFYGGTLRDHLITGPLTDTQAAALTAWALPRRML